MSPLVLLGCGMVIVVGSILWLRLHAFLALVLGAFAVALLTPEAALRSYSDTRVARSEMTATKFVDKPASGRVADEFGRTCANLGILIAMATIIGQAMLLSGAAEAIAAALLRWFGAARAHWAFFSAAFLLCIPVMLDTVMYLLAPLFKAVARRTGRDYLLLVMCTVAGGTITHSLVPPTPGPLFVAGDLGVPLGLMIGMGSAIGLGAALVGVAFARWSNRRHARSAGRGNARGIRESPPPVALARAPSGRSSHRAHWSRCHLYRRFENQRRPPRVAGKNHRRQGHGADPRRARRPRSARGPRWCGCEGREKRRREGAVILLIIAAGGAFGGVLQQTGIAGELAAHFQGIHALALPAVFLVTALVRTAQGSATGMLFSEFWHSCSPDQKMDLPMYLPSCFSSCLETVILPIRHQSPLPANDRGPWSRTSGNGHCYQ